MILREREENENDLFSVKLQEILERHTGKATAPHPEEPESVQETLNEYGKNIQDLTQRVEILEENNNRRKM